MSLIEDMFYLSQNLWYLLEKHNTAPQVGEDQMINYEDFMKVGSEAGPKCKLVHEYENSEHPNIVIYDGTIASM